MGYHRVRDEIKAFVKKMPGILVKSGEKSKT
jgi:hypothetical protein